MSTIEIVDISRATHKDHLRGLGIAGRAYLGLHGSVLFVMPYETAALLDGLLGPDDAYTPPGAYYVEAIRLPIVTAKIGVLPLAATQRYGIEAGDVGITTEERAEQLRKEWMDERGRWGPPERSRPPRRRRRCTPS